MDLNFFISQNTHSNTAIAAFTYLSFPVDSNYASSGVMWGRHKDCVTADPVHIDACGCLQVIQVHIAVLGDQENYTVFSTCL